MKPLKLLASTLLLLSMGLLGSCLSHSATHPSAATATDASGTPRPYNAPLREFQDPSAAR